MFERPLFVVFVTVVSVLLLGGFEMTLASAGDFDGDGYDDLAIGVPHEDIGGSP